LPGWWWWRNFPRRPRPWKSWGWALGQLSGSSPHHGPVAVEKAGGQQKQQDSHHSACGLAHEGHAPQEAWHLGAGQYLSAQRLPAASFPSIDSAQPSVTGLGCLSSCRLENSQEMWVRTVWTGTVKGEAWGLLGLGRPCREAYGVSSTGAVCDQNTSKFFVSHQEESMAGYMGPAWNSGWGWRLPKQCIHMWVSVKMIK
jgi:hypothetical protein